METVFPEFEVLFDHRRLCWGLWIINGRCARGAGVDLRRPGLVLPAPTGRSAVSFAL